MRKKGTYTHSARTNFIRPRIDADGGYASQLGVRGEKTHCSKTDRGHGLAYARLILAGAHQELGSAGK